MGVHESSVYVHYAICESVFGVMVFHTSIVNCSGEFDMSSVYVHSAICALIWCNGIPYIYCQLGC